MVRKIIQFWRRLAKGSLGKRIVVFSILGIVLGAVALFGIHQLWESHSKKPSPHSQSTTQKSGVKTDAWIYPDASGALTAVQDGRKLNAVKIEFLHVEDNGVLTQINQSSETPNGYSSTTVALLKQHSAEQYITVSGTTVGTAKAMQNTQTIPQIVQLADQTGFGIELDWEEFGQWDTAYYAAYKSFAGKLATKLHASHHKLLLDGPPIPDIASQKWYKWKYEELAPLVDGVVMMIYDNQYDAGVGAAIAPTDWSQQCLQWLKKTADAKGIAGIAAYGYKGDVASGKIAVNPSATIRHEAGAAQATRTRDGELAVKAGNTFYDYADQQTMRTRLQQVKQNGIAELSVWSLGGNPWF